MPHENETQAKDLGIEHTDRGFLHGSDIPSEYGGCIRAYESSAASGPHLWVHAECPENLNRPEGPVTSATVHLTLENATRLRDQLTYLIEHHYQVLARLQPGDQR